MLEKLTSAIDTAWDGAELKAKAMTVVLFQMLGLGENWTEAASNPFSMDTRAQAGGASAATNLVVGLVVAGLMAAFLLPIAIDEISAVDTTSWSNGAASLWDVLPIMVVLAIFLFFVGLALKAK